MDELSSSGLLCGTYLLHNAETGKGYVGSTKDAVERLKTHLYLLKNERHPNRRLQAAFRENPNFEMAFVSTATREEAFDFEQAILDDLKNNDLLLNLSTDARNCAVERTEETKQKISNALRGRAKTEETREKMRGRKQSEEEIEKRRIAALALWQNPEFRDRQRASLLGHHVSEETREKLRKSSTGKTVSEESRQKISAANRKAIIVRGQHFSCAEEASKTFGVSVTTIWRWRKASEDVSGV